jgi:superfamily II DNA or RNA helicase
MTASKSSFLKVINSGSNLLIIGDEVHSAGQPTFKSFLETEFVGPRMGLSATPERYGDEEGTQRIFDFFGKILEPRFTLEDAINAGRLTPYQYDFELVPLDFDEFERWNEFTRRISRAMAMQSKSSELNDNVKRLLTERARISKKAQGKIAVCYRIVRDNYKKGDRWLIYCSDRDQMTEARRVLSQMGYPLMDFHQAMLGGRDETLEIFTREGGIMLAIKCLDEGVDIPSINRAVILASSTNPREYVQRRGRVLRSAPNKHSAHIWDVLVTNPQGKLITRFEAVRAIEFAGTSTSIASKIALQSLLFADKMERDTEEFEEDQNED